MSRQVVSGYQPTAIGVSDQAQKAEATKGDEFSDRLLKLIPTEIVALYSAVFTMVKEMISPNEQVNDTLWYYAIFVLLIIGNLLYQKKLGVTDWKQLVITSLAFVLWVMSLGGPKPAATILGVETQIFAAIVVPLFTFFVPFFYPGVPMPPKYPQPDPSHPDDQAR